VSDLSTVSLLAIDQQLKKEEALSIEMRGVPGDEQIAAVELVLNHVRDRLVGAAFDATGMGWIVAEQMGRKFGLRETEDGSGLVWAIKFSEDWYRVNMPPLKAAFEDDTLAIIRDDDHMSDLRTVKMLRGIPRVPPTREGEKGKMRHGDYAIALVLADFAARMRWVEYGYRGATPQTTSPDGQHKLRQRASTESDNKRRDWWDSPLGSGLRGGM
jgi:phage FluMu gp28-like protein